MVRKSSSSISQWLQAIATMWLLALVVRKRCVPPNILDSADGTRDEWRVNEWLVLLVGALVTYRLSLLTALESGPGKIFRKIRNIPEPKSATKEGLSCLHCTSVYHAVPVTAFLWWRGNIEAWDTPLYWLAFSGLAIILHHTFTERFKK